MVKEQLLYELGDPKNYITPDCIADFTSICLSEDGRDRVRVSGVRGGPRTDMLKLSVSYEYGWKAIGTLVYSWPDALAKAQAANAIVRERLDRLGLPFEEIYTEYFGSMPATVPRLSPRPTRPRSSFGSACAGGSARCRPVYARVDPAGPQRSADCARGSVKADRRCAR